MRRRRRRRKTTTTTTTGMQYYQSEIEDSHSFWLRRLILWCAADYLARTECSDFSEEVAASIRAKTTRRRRQQFPSRRLYMYDFMAWRPRRQLCLRQLFRD